jgi:2-haloacid dehalogenase
MRAVIFDIGNVLIRWNPRFLYQKLIPDPAELDWFLSHVVTLDWHFQHDAGRPVTETVPELIAHFPDQAERIGAFVPRWLETIAGPIEGSVEILQRLKEGGTRVFAITNFSTDFWPQSVAAYPFLGWFDDVVVSGAERLLKPDPAIYHLAFQRFGVAPQEAFFVDDRPENVAAGEKLGMPGHIFTDSVLLAADLARKGFG